MGREDGWDGYRDRIDVSTRAFLGDIAVPRVSVYDPEVFDQVIESAPLRDANGLLSCPFSAIDGMLSLREPEGWLAAHGYLLRPWWEVITDNDALGALRAEGKPGYVFDLVVPRVFDGPLGDLNTLAKRVVEPASAALSKQVNAICDQDTNLSISFVSGDGFPEYHFDFACQVAEQAASDAALADINGYWNSFDHHQEILHAGPSIAANHISVFDELSAVTGDIELGESREPDVNAMIRDPAWHVIAHHDDSGTVDFASFLQMDLSAVDWFDPEALDHQDGFNVEYISTLPEARGGHLAYDAMRLGIALIPRKLGIEDRVRVMFNTCTNTVELVPTMAAAAITSTGYAIDRCRVDVIYRLSLHLNDQ